MEDFCVLTLVCGVVTSLHLDNLQLKDQGLLRRRRNFRTFDMLKSPAMLMTGNSHRFARFFFRLFLWPVLLFLSLSLSLVFG
jgi:hypothetical protein